MDFCIAQPLPEYDVEIERGQYAGLYSSYFTTPDTFAFILQCTLVPFEYESTSTLPLTHISTDFKYDFEPSLNFKLKGSYGEITVREMLNLGPVEKVVAGFLGADNLADMPFVKEICSGNVTTFKRILYARWLANKKWKAERKLKTFERRGNNLLVVDFEKSKKEALTEQQEKFLQDAINSVNKIKV